MFKLVFCVLFVAAAAKPDVLLTSQLGPLTTTYISPATAITKDASGFLSQGPLLYSSPFGYTHYIKKRSAPLTYIAPTTYLNKPVLTYTSPLTYSSPLWSSGLPIANAHFIKKRSPQLLTTSYIAPTYSAPWITGNTPLISNTPYLSQPITYATHLIKKRSAPVAYTAPATLAYQSGFNLRGTPIISTYGAPYAYSSNIPAYTHVI